MLGLGNSLGRSMGSSSPETAFVFTVKTDNAGTSNDDQFSVPITVSSGSNTGNYARPLCNIDWGDGTVIEDVGQDSDLSGSGGNRAIARATHTYSAGAGTYTIKISEGTSWEGSAWDSADQPPLQRWAFNNGADCQKMLEIENWGIWSSSYGAFQGCENLTCSATDAIDLGNVKGRTTFTADMQFMFKECPNFNGAIGNWDTSRVVGARGTFWSATSFNADISGWDMSSVTGRMDRFLYVAEAFNQNLGSWDVRTASNLSQFMATSSSILSTANYDALLIGWAEYADDMTYTGTPTFSATYTSGGAAETARDALIAGDWAGITDDGAA
tara:strand:- start:321 stop:1304 length:984 start_codon:yes stop_codon:yes gene_type:complete